MRTARFLSRVLFTVAAATTACVVAAGCGGRQAAPPAEPVTPLIGMPNARSTSREALAQTIAEMRAKTQARPSDASAAVTLADALLRQTRVTGQTSLAGDAELVLKRTLASDATRYDARRMLATVYLSQHRFRDAIGEAERCLAAQPRDAYVQGIIGDAHIELGEYEQAFRAFDLMNQQKPNAAAYARASYARELSGDLDAALRFMQMALDATGANDPESLAWHHAQLGHLRLERGELSDAAREFDHAAFMFPGHPLARDGQARVAVARGDLPKALALVNETLAGNPLPGDFAFAGDIEAALGRSDEAERHYRLAEATWTSDVPEPSRLARFLAERGRALPRAVELAERSWADRKDIFTADALAWAYFRTGAVDKAREAIMQATRTGSADRVIRYHAAAIAGAAGQRDAALKLVTQALDRSPRFDLVSAPAAARLRATLAQPAPTQP